MEATSTHRRRASWRSRSTALVAALGLSLTWFTAPVVAQNTDVGTISGTVSADQGDVRAFRIKARDSVHKIIYTVFTTGGDFRSTTCHRAPTRCGPSKWVSTHRFGRST